MSTIFRTLQVNKWQSKNQTFFSFCKINANKFGTKNEISLKIIYHYMTSYGYIIMIIVDSCMIWYHLYHAVEESCYIATNVISRKSATLFGDLPDWKCGSWCFLSCNPEQAVVLVIWGTHVTSLYYVLEIVCTEFIWRLLVI